MIKLQIDILKSFQYFYSIPKRNEVKRRRKICKSVAVKNEKHFWVKEENNFSQEMTHKTWL